MWDTIKLVGKNFKKLKSGDKAIIIFPIVFLLMFFALMVSG